MACSAANSHLNKIICTNDSVFVDVSANSPDSSLFGDQNHCS